MKIRQLEKLFVVVLAVLCCGLGVQLRLSLKENGKGTVVYKKKVTTEEPAPLPEAYDLRQKHKEPEVKPGDTWNLLGSRSIISVRICAQTTGKADFFGRSYVTVKLVFKRTE